MPGGGRATQVALPHHPACGVSYPNDPTISGSQTEAACYQRRQPAATYLWRQQLPAPAVPRRTLLLGLNGIAAIALAERFVCASPYAFNPGNIESQAFTAKRRGQFF
mgnify:CR=1 FL=1